MKIRHFASESSFYSKIMNKWISSSNTFNWDEEPNYSTTLHFHSQSTPHRHSSFPKTNLALTLKSVQLPRASKETKCFALSSLNNPCMPRDQADALSASKVSSPLIRFQKPVTLVPYQNHLPVPWQRTNFLFQLFVLKLFLTISNLACLLLTSGKYNSISSSQRAENKQTHFKENRNTKAFTSFQLFILFSFSQRMNSS